MYSQIEYETTLEAVKEQFHLNDEDIISATKSSFKKDNLIFEIDDNTSKKTKEDVYAKITIKKLTGKI